MGYVDIHLGILGYNCFVIICYENDVVFCLLYLRIHK